MEYLRSGIGCATSIYTGAASGISRGLSPTVMFKADIIDPTTRIRKLVVTWENHMAREFLRMVGNIQSEFKLDELARLLEQGQIEQAFQAAHAHVVQFADETAVIFTGTARSTAAFLRDKDFAISYNATNQRAVNLMVQNRDLVIKGFTEQQIGATQAALAQGIERGLNPGEVARTIRKSVGLTEYEVGVINNYERAVRTGSSRALQYELRDKRFDSTMQRAIDEGTFIPEAQVRKMVDRYRQRWINYRARTVARSQALPIVHQANDEMYAQAVEAGLFGADEVVGKWRNGTRPRNSHRAMSGQERQLGDPFISGAGNFLMYPGDFRAPISDIANCVCVVSRRIKRRTT